ncbi:MAG: hypothetical protein ABSC30_09880 [Acidimicrobiales bacterium]|jgi:hypothetical protein
MFYALLAVAVIVVVLGAGALSLFLTHRGDPRALDSGKSSP